MKYIKREITPQLIETLNKHKSVLLLGPRQTGKTTLINELPFDRLISFIQPQVRQRYEKEIGLLTGEIEALANEKNKTVRVVIDEIQKLPLVLDVVQDLIDRKVANFILTGSSARKLKRQHDVNLLPGRVIPYSMDSLYYPEIATFTPTLESLLLYGSLPEIFLTQSDADKETLLSAYVSIYLEEEVRAESLVRNLPSFVRFLTLAAEESGQPVNYLKLSQEIGVAHSTIASYYQILEDCLIVLRIDPYTKSKTRKKLTKFQKYIFFDLGVRRIAADEGLKPSREKLGHLFEQFIALELSRTLHLTKKKIKLHYWRDPSGPEVDWLLEKDGELIPLEVKWTNSPNKKDARHLITFINEYELASKGYIICQTPHKIKITDNIEALPWQDIYELI